MTQAPSSLPSSPSSPIAVAAAAARLDGVAPLPHLGVIRAEGEDAARFLHGQLTQDFALLQPGEWRLAAYCSAKGRMLASFIGFKRGPSEVLLIVSRDILPATLKRLSMFVLRSKLKLTDATDAFELRGLAGSATKVVAVEDRATGTIESFDSQSLLWLPPVDGQPRALWLAPVGTPAPAGAALDPALWQWGEVRSGIATITQPIVEAFVPQMLNYESVGGVNFKKGCYPGQEVVARSQFRGTLKRRAWRVHADVALAPGQEVFSANEPDQPCGLVAQGAPAPGGGWDGIVSVQISAADSGQLRLGAADGAALALLPLPYPLLDDL